MTDSLPPAAPAASATDRERAAVIAQGLQIVATTLPGHDVHSCCRVQREIAALDRLRAAHDDSSATAHAQT